MRTSAKMSECENFNSEISINVNRNNGKSQLTTPPITIWKCERHNLTNVLLLFCWHRMKAKFFHNSQSHTFFIWYNHLCMCVQRNYYGCYTVLCATFMIFSCGLNKWTVSRTECGNLCVCFYIFVAVINVKSSKVFLCLFFFFIFISLSVNFHVALFNHTTSFAIKLPVFAFQVKVLSKEKWDIIREQFTFIGIYMVRIFMHISSDYDYYMLIFIVCASNENLKNSRRKLRQSQSHHSIICIYITCSVFSYVRAWSAYHFYDRTTIFSFEKYK